MTLEILLGLCPNSERSPSIKILRPGKAKPFRTSDGIAAFRILQLMLRAEQSLDYAIARFQSFRESLWLVAATFGHVGFAATFAANDGCEFLNNQPGWNLLCEIVRSANDERGFAVIAAADYDHS